MCPCFVRPVSTGRDRSNHDTNRSIERKRGDTLGRQEERSIVPHRCEVDFTKDDPCKARSQTKKVQRKSEVRNRMEWNRKECEEDSIQPQRKSSNVDSIHNIHVSARGSNVIFVSFHGSQQTIAPYAGQKGDSAMLVSGIVPRSRG